MGKEKGERERNPQVGVKAVVIPKSLYVVYFCITKLFMISDKIQRDYEFKNWIAIPIF